MPAISAAISAIFSFILALEGKTIPPTSSDFVKKIQAEITAGLAAVSQILSTIAQNAGQPVLQQIEAAFQSIVTNLNSLLAGLNVTDNPTITKIEKFIEIAVAAIEAVLVLIPLAAVKVKGLSIVQEQRADKAATLSIKNAHKVLQADYHEAVTTQTQSVDVNEALAALPQTLP
jgi:hypothetical protein